MINQLKDLETATVKTHLPTIIIAEYIIVTWQHLFQQAGLILMINLLN